MSPPGESAVPDVPRLESLEEEHLKTVFNLGTVGARLLHRGGGVGIVDKVIAEMIGSEKIIGDVGAAVNVGIHAERSAVDNHLVGGHDFGSKVGIADDTFCGQCATRT